MPFVGELDRSPDWRKISLPNFMKLVSSPPPPYLHFQSITIEVIEVCTGGYIFDKANFFPMFQPLVPAFFGTRLVFDYFGKHFNSGTELLDYMASTLLPVFSHCREVELLGSPNYNHGLKECVLKLPFHLFSFN